AGSSTRILGVSVLTSMNETALREEAGVNRPLKEQVEHLVGLGLKVGVHGVVSSPEETRDLREKFGLKFLIVNPGIRGAEDSKGDQKRTATPKAAMENGASYLVVGRPIIAAPDPLAAAEKILAEIAG
ncbi:MAG: orotidine 5'-phosphate decarboxylase, partial [Spirochaetia bacterium]|nr:orotidine 5'-phosphate decarboxylase [Spirochaetia bacterium]